MKINQISNTNFGALMLEKPKNKLSENQRKIINIAKNRIEEDDYFINLLENKHSDVYLSPRSDGETVDLKVLTAGGLTYNYIPKDKNGEVKMKLFFPKTREVNESRCINNIEIKTSKFLNRAINCLYGKFFNIENFSTIKEIENLSEADMMSKNHCLLKPDIIPDARCLLGNSQVMTRSYLKRNYYV